MLLAEHGFHAKDVSDRRDRSTTDSRWKDVRGSICIGKNKKVEEVAQSAYS